MPSTYNSTTDGGKIITAEILRTILAKFAEDMSSVETTFTPADKAKLESALTSESQLNANNITGTISLDNLPDDSVVFTVSGEELQVNL